MQGLLAFKRYVQFVGRAGRKEYWQFVGIALGIYIATAFLGDGMAYAEAGLFPPFMIIALLALMVPAYCVTIRRLHDRGISGLWLAAIWVLNGIYYALENLRAGSRGTIADAPLALLIYADLFLTLGFTIWLLVHLGREGDTQANVYGAPPVEDDTETRNTESMQLINQALHGLMAGDLVPARAHSPKGPVQGEDRLSQIERLARLRQDGILTDAEFEQQKAALLQ